MKEEVLCESGDHKIITTQREIHRFLFLQSEEFAELYLLPGRESSYEKKRPSTLGKFGHNGFYVVGRSPSIKFGFGGS